MARTFTGVVLLSIAPMTVLLFTACQERAVAPELSAASAAGQAKPDAAVQLLPPTADLDADWARVAETEVPGFAGFWRTPTGRYFVAVTSRTYATLAAEYVRTRTPGMSQVEAIDVQEVTFPYYELYRWKLALLTYLDRDNVFWLDIDEVQNALVFGVASDDDGEAVLKAVQGVGVPRDAVTFVVTKRPVERINLSDTLRPVVGGVVVTRSTGSSCTLGFNATKGLDRVFVTAAHCSTNKFATDGSVQYQAYLPDRIGVEVLDPIPSPLRRSDAALYLYDSGVPADWGYIARTTYAAVNARGSTTIDGANPGFRVTGEAANAVQVIGSLVNKMGAVSGWTQGQVLRTCVTLSGMPCQWEARVWSEHGDSGSPMFQQNGPFEPAAGHITLWGVLWGGPPGDWTTTWYSPISAVRLELGALNFACDPDASSCFPPVSALINGLPTIRQQGYYAYSASAAHGDGTYTYSWQVCNEIGTGCVNYGTGTSITLYFSAGDPSVLIRCSVSSAGQQTIAELGVNVIF